MDVIIINGDFQEDVIWHWNVVKFLLLLIFFFLISELREAISKFYLHLLVKCIGSTWCDV